MKRLKTDDYLHESLVLLIGLCGIDAVKAALRDIEAGSTKDNIQQSADRGSGASRAVIPRVVLLLEETDPAKYKVLRSFFESVDSGTLLPEAEDIRMFAEHLGMKQISGRSRRDLIPKLAQALVNAPLTKLDVVLPKATDISAKDRRKGYSVLTDKLLENVKAAS